jgi:hypothetical protein
MPVEVDLRLQRRPFRWRIGLKTLLAVVLVVGLGLGWVARNVHRVEAQPAVIAQLRRVGVQVAESKPSIWALIAQLLRDPASLKQLHDRRNPLLGRTVTAISLPRLTDEQATDVVERLSGLSDLEWMTVPKTGLSPTAIEAIKSSLPSVEIEMVPQPPALTPK